MDKEKIANWSSQAKEFFRKSQDNSLVLELLVSSFWDSQKREAFESLVEAINQLHIAKKIKKVNIIDMTYLYRYVCNSDFETFQKQNCSNTSSNLSSNGISDGTFFNSWYLENSSSLFKLEVPYKFKDWANEINNSCLQQIRERKVSDSNFKELVTAEAAIYAYRYSQTIEQCIDFVLEKYAYLYSHLGKNVILSHEIISADEYLNNILRKPKLNINFISYEITDSIEIENETGKPAEKRDKAFKNNLKTAQIQAAISDFMQNKATNMNFYVIDTKGSLIYSNFALEKLVNKTLTAEEIDEKAWKTTREVLISGKTFIGEEYRDNGSVYLSMKSPLWIDQKIEGVIGLSLNITDSKRIEIERKRATDLEFLNKLQQVKINFQNEFAHFILQMAHDITSPLASLEVFAKSCKQLPSEHKFLLSAIISNIKNVADDLLQKYKYNKRGIDASKMQNILVLPTVMEIVNQKRLQYGKENVLIEVSCDPSAERAFVSVDQTSFGRMISNLINNAVDACREQSRFLKNETSQTGLSKTTSAINVNLTIIKQNVTVEVVDNGSGIPPNMVAQINDCVPVATTKEAGHGLGLSQVLETVRLHRGRVNVDSKEGCGTKFSVSFPIANQPEWLDFNVVLPKDCAILVFSGEDINSFPLKLRTYLERNFGSRGKLHFFENAYDFENFVNSLPIAQREDIFVMLSYKAMDSESEEILDVVLRSSLMEKFVVLTEVCNSKRLQDFVKMLGGQMIPRQFIDTAEMSVV